MFCYLITSLQDHLRHSRLNVPLMSLQLSNGMSVRVGIRRNLQGKFRQRSQLQTLGINPWDLLGISATKRSRDTAMTAIRWIFAIRTIKTDIDSCAP